MSTIPSALTYNRVFKFHRNSDMAILYIFHGILSVSQIKLQDKDFLSCFATNVAATGTD
jgi:hypothetical protein